jgi:hypothetical protein
LKQKQTKSTKKNSTFVSFVPFCSKEIRAIRAIRAIRGGIFAKMSDSDGLQRKSSFVYAPFVPFCGYSRIPVCSPCNRLLRQARRHHVLFLRLMQIPKSRTETG